MKSSQKCSVYKKRQTPANLQYLNKQKIFLQNLTKESKLTFHKNITEYLNRSNDANQIWHSYGKVLKNKKNNIVEPLYYITTGTYVFEGMNSYISEKLFNHHIKNEKQGKTSDNTFITNIENKLKSVAQTDFTLSNVNFF